MLIFLAETDTVHLRTAQPFLLGWGDSGILWMERGNLVKVWCAAVYYKKLQFRGGADWLKVVTVNTSAEKLKLAKQLGADLVIDPTAENPAEKIKSELGGVQASIVTAVNKKAFDNPYSSLKRGGTLVLVGLPPEKMEVPILNTVLDGTEIIGLYFYEKRGSSLWDGSRFFLIGAAVRTKDPISSLRRDIIFINPVLFAVFER
ncbi:zinc-binding dehydrogenase [Paenibacillus sp. FSL K6-0276]|uniref:zinc-binding dehydrogenase n=1 Tax=Paenibacillus sp. FSL K6-0276 TaxID=2921450 RepID=UPI0030EBB358